jgi:hypothetical protein
MVQEDLDAEKDRVVSSRHPPKCGTNDSDRQLLLSGLLPNLRTEMHPAAKLQFERAVREFAQWRAVPADERSPAPAWWWQPAFEVVTRQEEMPPLCSIRLELPLSST